MHKLWTIGIRARFSHTKPEIKKNIFFLQIILHTVLHIRQSSHLLDFNVAFKIFFTANVSLPFFQPDGYQILNASAGFGKQ